MVAEAARIPTGHKANKSDVCLYVCHIRGGAAIVLLLYVDDIILAASTADLMDKYAGLISKTFRVSSEGPLTSYLGFDIVVHGNTTDTFPVYTALHQISVIASQAADILEWHSYATCLNDPRHSTDSASARGPLRYRAEAFK